MPKEGSFVEFHDGQNQFIVPFTMYADFEAILRPVQGPNPTPKKLIITFLLVLVFIASLLMERLKTH